MQQLLVLADANVLVKDVVFFVFYDLAKSQAIDLRWTPQIEAEYVKHRARLRAQAQGRETELQDMVWAAERLKPIKKQTLMSPSRHSICHATTTVRASFGAKTSGKQRR